MITSAVQAVFIFFFIVFPFINASSIIWNFFPTLVDSGGLPLTDEREASYGEACSHLHVNYPSFLKKVREIHCWGRGWDGDGVRDTSSRCLYIHSERVHVLSVVGRWMPIEFLTIFNWTLQIALSFGLSMSWTRTINCESTCPHKAVWCSYRLIITPLTTHIFNLLNEWASRKWLQGVHLIKVH